MKDPKEDQCYFNSITDIDFNLKWLSPQLIQDA